MFRVNALPIQYHQALLPFIVIVICLAAYFFESNSFHFHRELFSNGEYWRGVTSHFLHTNVNHLLLNISAVFLLWALHGKFYTLKNYALVFIVSAISATFGIYYYSPEIMKYVGLSGVLHGFFIWGAIKDIQRNDKTGYLLLLGVIGKVTHEQVVGASEDVAELISATVAVDAHLWGMIGGALVGLCSIVKLLTTTPNTNELSK